MDMKMTPGERLIWAAEFVRMMGAFRPDARREIGDAVRAACAKVRTLRLAPSCAGYAPGPFTDEERAMLDDMLTAAG